MGKVTYSSPVYDAGDTSANHQLRFFCVTKDDAERYFAIRPDVDASSDKILAIA